MKSRSLARYDAACQAIAVAKSVDEVKSIRDKAEAMRAYARVAKNRRSEADMAEIRIRAERRLGEMIAEQKATEGLNPGAAGAPGPGRGNKNAGQFWTRVLPPTLAELGIDKHLADRARKLAAVPAKQFNSMLGEWRERVQHENERITVNLLRAGDHELQRAADRERIIGGRVSDLRAFIAAGNRCGTIYIDPPWIYTHTGTKNAAADHYEGLSVDELAALPVGALAAPNAHLHLWTTNAFLFDCPRLFEAWGFEFRSSFIWVKPQLGLGNYWRLSHEMLLTAVRGDVTRFDDHNLKSWLRSDRGRHSAKPDEVRSLIERASPAPRIELFTRAVTPGWYAWGHEIGGVLLRQPGKVRRPIKGRA